MCLVLDSRKRNIFDRPPTRSGGNTETEEPVKPGLSNPHSKNYELLFKTLHLLIYVQCIISQYCANIKM